MEELKLQIWRIAVIFKQKPKLFLIAGANATFKSTYAPFFVDDNSKTIHIDFDEEKNRNGNLNDVLINQKLKQLEEEAFFSKKDLAFQSNLLDPDDIKIFADKAKDNGYEFHVIFLSTTNIQQNIAYNALRGRMGKHCVSNYTIELSFQNSYESVKSNLTLFDSLKVYDVTNNNFKDITYADNKYISAIKPNKLIVRPELVADIQRHSLVFKKRHAPLFYENLIKDIPSKILKNKSYGIQ